MLKQAHSAIVKSSQPTLTKQQKLDQIIDKQFSLQKDGILLSAETLLRNPEKAQDYITILKKEMTRQKELDTQKKMKEAKLLSKKTPNINSKPTYIQDR